VEAQDAIRRKFGSRALTRARLVGDALAEPGGRDPMQPLVQRRVGRARSADGAPTRESAPPEEGAAKPARDATTARPADGPDEGA
jgi:hypothetical protein